VDDAQDAERRLLELRDRLRQEREQAADAARGAPGP
jgi:hypothetical protein